MSCPINPSLELVMQWVSLACEYEGNETWIDLATQAARWGADRQLEMCKEWLEDHVSDLIIDMLHDAMRPKPPSLADSAKESLESVVECLKMLMPGAPVDGVHIANIRAALERLQELEKGDD